jgi:hypothetical protein
MDKLGVFYICYKEKDAIHYSLNKFREFYPTSPIYLVSDNGHDYSYLKEMFSNIETIKENTEVVGVARNCDEYIQIHKGKNDHFMEIVMEFLRRLNNACLYCKTDYILLMEPDVLVRGPLTMPSADLVGPTANVMPRVIQDYILKHGGKNNGTWGPSGGIMKTKSFQKIYKKLIKDPSKLYDGVALDPRMICYDYLLAFLFSLYGYTYENNPEETECIRNPSWKTSGHPLLHQYRENYNNNYEGKWK